MASVTGPISTLPGSSHLLPEGTMCDDHPDVFAVKRLQGETDSFGSEMFDACQSCVDEQERYIKEARSGNCEWCGKSSDHLSNRRDYDEGSCGPIYRVCLPCIRKQNDDDAAELKWLRGR